MEKEIIGYKCPTDLWGGKVKKDTVYSFKTSISSEAYPNHYKTATHGVPKEIIKTWEPCYKEEFTYKVGDYLYCLKDFIMDDGSIDYKKDKIYKSEDTDYITDEENVYHRMTNDCIDTKDLSIYFRHATPEEIASIKEERVVMAEGFELIIKNNEIIHEKDNTNITNYVKSIRNWWVNKFDSGNNTSMGYDFIIKPEDIVISKTGCQEKKTTLKQWLDLYDKIK